MAAFLIYSINANAGSLYDEGQITYQTRCTACHNSDPTKPGSIGPDVFGSSRALIEARVMRASYPKGYRPKRNTNYMPPIPDLEDKIDALYKYLNGDYK